MPNYLQMPKQRQVVARFALGWSYRRIQAETGVRRETVGRYDRARQAKAATVFPGSAPSGRFVRTLMDRRRAVGVFHCAPGAEARVDFFRGAATLPRGNRRVARRPWVFRMTLGHSRHGYEEAVWDQRLDTFLRLHERAFRDLGGVAVVVRHDNLKAAVVRACLYDPDSKEVYLAFAKHWNFTPLPTQPRHRRKTVSKSGVAGPSKTMR